MHESANGGSGTRIDDHRTLLCFAMEENSGASAVRRAESPAPQRPGAAAARGEGTGAAVAAEIPKVYPVVNYALTICQGFSSQARLESVVRSGSTTLLKLDPGKDSTATKQFATLAALRLAFPFYTVSLVENQCTGNSQLQLLFCSDDIAYGHAKDYYKDYKVFKALRAISWVFAVSSVVSFACLLYGDASIYSQHASP